MGIRPLIVVAGLVAQALVPVVAVAADATLVGTPTVSSAPGGSAAVAITLRAGPRPTAPVLLEVRVGGGVVGRLADAPLSANQTKLYRIPITVPGNAAGTLELRIFGWGTELGRASAAVQATSEGAASGTPSGRQSGPPPV